MSENSKKIVLSKELENNIYFKYCLQKEKIEILTGRILFEYLLFNCLEYIYTLKNEELYKQEITILSNNPTNLNFDNIINLAKNVKRLHIVTENFNKFKKLEQYLQEELGIYILITNNKRKSLLKTKIIINLDFSEEILNKFNINMNAIIINMKEKIEIKKKSFYGINISDYQINYKDRFKDEEFKLFNKNILYESIISKLKDYNEVIRTIQQDEVKIVNLLGRKGIINKVEYLRN